MTISTKLATDFVKRHNSIFKFPEGTDMKHLSYWDIAKASVRYNDAEIKPFCLDTGSTSCMMVILPTLLKPNSSTLEEMLNKLNNSEIDVRTMCYGYTAPYRVTTNRLIVLEKLFEKSGILEKRAETSQDKKELILKKIQEMHSEASSTFANMTNQLNELWELINK